MLISLTLCQVMARSSAGAVFRMRRVEAKKGNDGVGDDEDYPESGSDSGQTLQRGREGEGENERERWSEKERVWVCVGE